MIKVSQNIVEIAPFRAKRHVDSVPSNKASDASYWAAQMACVSSQRDRASFMRIYDHFAPRLQRYLRTLGVSESIADELVQETLLKLWRKAHQFDSSRASLSTWLFRVGRNAYIDHVRREPNWRPVQEGIAQMDRDESTKRNPDPESFVDQDALRQAIDELSPLEAKLVRMSYLETRSHREIALDLDMPLGTVKSSLRRAFAKLQRRMRSPR